MTASFARIRASPSCRVGAYAPPIQRAEYRGLHGRSIDEKSLPPPKRMPPLTLRRANELGGELRGGDVVDLSRAENRHCRNRDNRSRNEDLRKTGFPRGRRQRGAARIDMVRHEHELLTTLG